MGVFVSSYLNKFVCFFRVVSWSISCLIRLRYVKSLQWEDDGGGGDDGDDDYGGDDVENIWRMNPLIMNIHD